MFIAGSRDVRRFPEVQRNGASIHLPNEPVCALYPVHVEITVEIASKAAIASSTAPGRVPAESRFESVPRREKARARETSETPEAFRSFPKLPECTIVTLRVYP